MSNNALPPADDRLATEFVLLMGVPCTMPSYWRLKTEMESFKLIMVNIR